MPTQLVAHLHFCQSHKAKQKIQKSYQPNAQQSDRKKGYAYNKGFVKWRVNGFD